MRRHNTVVNLTGNTVRIFDGSAILEIEPERSQLRVVKKHIPVRPICRHWKDGRCLFREDTPRPCRSPCPHGCGVWCVEERTVGVIGLPPRDGRIYIVPREVLHALAELGLTRDDLFTPDTTAEGAIHDERGRLIAAKRLVRPATDRSPHTEGRECSPARHSTA